MWSRETLLSASAATIVALLALSPACAYGYAGCTAGEVLTGSGNVTSPGYPDFYPDLTECTWILSAGPGQIVRLLIATFYLETGGYDFLSIYHGTDTSGAPLDNLTNDILNRESTYGNTVLLRFRSDESVNSRGFLIYFDSIYPPGSPLSIPQTCGASRQSNAIITTPNYPGNYPKNVICTWTLQADTERVVKLRFKEFDLGYGRDSLTVYSHTGDQNTTDAPRLFTAATLPPVLSLGKNATIIFNSTGILQYTGFLIIFTSACEATLRGHGNITSPNYPNNYPSFTSCLWSLNTTDGSNVTLTFYSFDVEPDDSVEVYDGSGSLIARYMGRDTSGGFSASFNMPTVTLAFYGNTEDAAKSGFGASFGSKLLV